MTDPSSSFLEVAARHARCFWLDGGGARHWSGRRSIVGWLDEDDVSLTYDAASREVTRHAGGVAEVVGGDVFEVLRDELASGAEGDQWFGYLGYACRPDLPARTGGPVPDAVWLRPRHVRLFEHPPATEAAAPAAAPRRADAPPTAAYAAAFERVQEHLHAGNSYEVNLTHRDTLTSDLDPASAYLRLRTLNPAPYAGFLQHDVPGARAWLLSSSPERYALVAADRTIETKPIKGTTPRGSTPEADAHHREQLATDPRYRAENLMIVDLLRNDVSMVAEPGTVEVPTLMEVETYTGVHQLVSTVRGRLSEGVSTLDALRALFPAGSMTGAPKLRTMQIVEEVETTPRSAYSGAFGWIAADGRADLGVVIRSLVSAGDGTWTLGTGGGITVHSDVASEYAEAAWKADRLRAVFEG
ncbi:anthranilate synthase component I family protein [Nocardioides euryhalodurans]|uniref:Anthranilate synthase component I family protein n=1 Tax=Nocardioides euryhalodurans TaxID=2518370 RepID=A0A4P7GM43_9ACTN|nr:anthranilate synthase component I family protein [Nocardioides euryhalodurans]QBR93073.1 anthranilate synthase component I family protein [Nocardioides euryhalodurans]